MNNYRFNCSDCHYFTNKKSSYDKHLLTKKHHIKINCINVNFCIECQRQFYDKSNYLKHLDRKHKIDVSELKNKDYYLMDMIKSNKKENLESTPIMINMNSKCKIKFIDLK